MEKIGVVTVKNKATEESTSALILFGSEAKKSATLTSDVDLALTSKCPAQVMGILDCFIHIAFRLLSQRGFCVCMH